MHTTHSNWTTRGYANSWIANSRTGYLADWSTRGLDKSRTGQLAVSHAAKRTKTKHAKSMVASASCPVRESSSPRVGNPRVGVSASCPVTTPSTSLSADRLSNSFISRLNSTFVMKFTLRFKVPLTPLTYRYTTLWKNWRPSGSRWLGFSGSTYSLRGNLFLALVLQSYRSIMLVPSRQIHEASAKRYCRRGAYFGRRQCV